MTDLESAFITLILNAFIESKSYKDRSGFCANFRNIIYAKPFHFTTQSTST